MTWDGQSFAMDETSVRDINKILMQRYSLITKVKEAQVIGILVGTVVVDGYLDIMAKLK